VASIISRVRDAGGKGLLGTWVKIPSFETMQLLGHAGFDFVVIDMEHAPHTLQRAVELVFAAQAMGLAALVRLPVLELDHPQGFVTGAKIVRQRH
jgi:2-dehydro-3-deoxyglucarate aldolase/4-hydroxy-2-oxoheptanedioate aldolase